MYSTITNVSKYTVVHSEQNVHALPLYMYVIYIYGRETIHMQFHVFQPLNAILLRRYALVMAQCNWVYKVSFTLNSKRTSKVKSFVGLFWVAFYRDLLWWFTVGSCCGVFLVWWSVVVICCGGLSSWSVVVVCHRDQLWLSSWSAVVVCHRDLLYMSVALVCCDRLRWSVVLLCLCTV